MKKNALKSEVEKVATTQPETPVENPTGANVPQVVEVDSKKPISSISLDDIAGHAADKAPEPNTSAIARTEEKEKLENQQANKPGQNQAGKKRGPYNKDGKEKKSTRSQVNTGKTTDEQKTEDYQLCYKAGAETIDSLVTMTAGMMGPEWYWMPPQKRKIPHPNRPGEWLEIEFDERTKGTDAFGKLYAHYGWGQPSPLMGVTLFAVAYFGIRLKNPEVKAKAVSAWEKAKLWLTKNKIEREAAKRKLDAEKKVNENRNQDGAAD